MIALLNLGLPQTHGQFGTVQAMGPSDAISRATVGAEQRSPPENCTGTITEIIPGDGDDGTMIIRGVHSNCPLVYDQVTRIYDTLVKELAAHTLTLNNVAFAELKAAHISDLCGINFAIKDYHVQHDNAAYTAMVADQPHLLAESAAETGKLVEMDFHVCANRIVDSTSNLPQRTFSGDHFVGDDGKVIPATCPFPFSTLSQCGKQADDLVYVAGLLDQSHQETVQGQTAEVLQNKGFGLENALSMVNLTKADLISLDLYMLHESDAPAVNAALDKWLGKGLRPKRTEHYPKGTSAFALIEIASVAKRPRATALSTIDEPMEPW